MSDSPENGFLARWSRRKREEVREPAMPAAPAPETPVPETAPQLTEEELAALPPVESIGADTDIAAFLREGVPEALRNAALRRAWAADPAVRDYVSQALDYAYDWNVPGGVPGFGPLEPGTDVAAMVRAMFGEGERSRVGEGSAASPSPLEGEGGPRVSEGRERGNAPQGAPAQADQHGTALPSSVASRAPVGAPPLPTSPDGEATLPLEGGGETGMVVVELSASEQGTAPYSMALTPPLLLKGEGGPTEPLPPSTASPRRHGGALPR